MLALHCVLDRANEHIGEESIGFVRVAGIIVFLGSILACEE
jgi:hypothetical protein